MPCFLVRVVGSNPHGLLHRNLNPARLPIPPYPHVCEFYHSPPSLVNPPVLRHSAPGAAIATGGQIRYNRTRCARPGGGVEADRGRASAPARRGPVWRQNRRGWSGGVIPLLQWYQEHARVLPWRSDPTPYRVWVSEIMLQQTRVAAVIGYFERFMTALPTISALAQADEDQLMKLWQGLGVL